MTPTQTEQITSTIPSWAQPYASQLLGSVFGGRDPTTGAFRPGLVGQGYQPYGKQRVAGFSPLQQQGMEGIAGMKVAPEMGEASGLASLAGRMSGQMGMSYQPMQYQSMGLDFLRTQAPQLQQFQMGPAERVGGPGGFERVTGPSGFERVNAPGVSTFQMGPAERVGAERFGGAQAAEYMSPYMENVVEQQKRGAIQDYRRQLPGIGAAAARVGGRGGTREALLQSEANRNLQGQLQGIEATGRQGAFQQAQQQFGADRAAAMQAGMANQQAGLTTGQQNLASLLSTQQLGTQTGLQSQLANQAAAQQAAQMGMTAQQLNQAAGLQTGQMGLQAALANQQAGLTTGQQNLAALLGVQQLGSGQNLQSQLANQQSGLQTLQMGLGQNQAAQQMMEQSRQFGANLGLQGLQQQLAAAGALGGLGMQRYQQGMGITQAQLGAGAQGQALEQEMLNQRYQDFINQQQFPYKQAEFGMGLLRGIPATGQTGTLYQQSPNLFAQIAGAGAGLGSLFGSLGSGGGR